MFNVAIADITATFNKIRLVGVLGGQDIAQRYRRSTIGAFWLTISMGVMIGSIGLVFGKLFNSPMAEFLPFLTLGLTFWTFFVSALTEGCTSFISGEAIIKQLPLPLFLHVLRVVWRNIIILAHNFIIFPILCLVFMQAPCWSVLLFIPGLFVFVFNVTWLSLLLGILSTRFRDTPQIVSSILQVVFYLTPIMWMPSLLVGRRAVVIVDYNPMHHLLELVRAPLLGEYPTLMNWLVPIAISIVGCLGTLMLYNRTKKRIAFWL